ncbi:MAG: bifunctional oligoribonuclease/PAP phosphatase NrnA [Candidatus Gracilibacteria bacterium]
MKEKINKLGKLINASKKILLINHIRMDMDAFGSLASMYDILNELGKEVKAINDELPLKNFSFIGYNDIIEPDLNLKEFNPDLIISLDAGSIDRLGISYKNNKDIFDKTDFVVIDHHITNQGFGDLNIINKTSSSTCEIIFEILTQLNLEKYITPKTATALLSGIYTDTNIFYNSNTTSSTYLVAAKLLEYGADFRKPYYELYKKKTLSQSKLWGEILVNNMKVSENGKLIWAMIPKTVFKKVGANDRDLEGLISEFFTNIEGVEICFISYEIEGKIIKTSFRSTKKYDVSMIAGKFGGGGHKQASGFVSTKPLLEVEKEILDKIIF